MKSREHGWWRAPGGSLALYAFIGTGAAIGGVARMLVSLAALEWSAGGFPWGTLCVNVVGSFVIGFYATLTEPGGRFKAGDGARHFVTTGLCGGFTTFSVFSLESVQYLAAAQYGMAALYIGVSIATWLGAAWLGIAAASRLNRLGGGVPLSREMERVDDNRVA
ncbi:CrcB family protein [Aurantimonas sp. HBX-1]|uniref:fluoride efflux transporter FluC n=1 Tax=Aurantimonas sp. HBX-1 TaxID=2906072 RepID=UPI001F2997DA|nr:CrcB family protein [Aurantimonas sp. HBX-1]UIJ73697.1 CrcB family protein [Aurantimonas sp. HBX-1]